jgi:hypothetical protein
MGFECLNDQDTEGGIIDSAYNFAYVYIRVHMRFDNFFKKVVKSQITPFSYFQLNFHLSLCS